MSAARVLGPFALVPEDLPASHAEPWRRLWSVAIRTPGAWRIGRRRAAELADVSVYYADRLWKRIRACMVAMGRWQSASERTPRTPYSRGLTVVVDDVAAVDSASEVPSRAEEELNTPEQIQPKARARARGGSRSAGSFWWRWARVLSRSVAQLEVDRLRHEDGYLAGDCARAWHVAGGFEELDRMASGRSPGVRGVGAHLWRFKVALGLVERPPAARGRRLVDARFVEPTAAGPADAPIVAAPPHWLAEPTAAGVEYLRTFLPIWSVDLPVNVAAMLDVAPWIRTHPDLSGLVGVTAA